MSPLRTGILGGSFDPPHRGHEYMAVQAVRQLKLQELLLLPSGQSPFKAEHRASGEHRLAMLEFSAAAIGSACDGLEIAIDGLELEREGPSYTVDSIERLAGRLGERDLFLIIGEDNLDGFHRWKDWQKLLGLVELAVVTRPGHQKGIVPSELEDYSDSVHFIGGEGYHASSTEIRDSLSRGEKPGSMLNERVFDYIRFHSLYLV